MRNKNLIAQLIYRAILTIVAITATVFTITDHIESCGGDNRPTALFFTSWSVWLALVTAVASLVFTIVLIAKKNKEGDNKALPLLKFCANIMIIATFIVSAFVLPDKIWTKGYWTWGSAFKHFLLPILTVLDTVLFDQRNRYRISYPFFGVGLPLIYWIVVVIRMKSWTDSVGFKSVTVDQCNQYFPYGFTNIMPKDQIIGNSLLPASEQIGGKSLGGLIGLLAGICVGLILIGFVFWAIDKLRKENGKIKFDKSIDEENTWDFIHLMKPKAKGKRK